MDASTANAYLDPALADTRAECERLRAELAEIKARRCGCCRWWEGPKMNQYGVCRLIFPHDHASWSTEWFPSAHFCAYWEAADALR